MFPKNLVQFIQFICVTREARYHVSIAVLTMRIYPRFYESPKRPHKILGTQK